MGFISSKDGEVSWSQISEGAEGPVDFHAMTISRADPHVLYTLYQGIQISRDGGHNWTIAGSDPSQVIDLAASAHDPLTAFAATLEGLCVSKDGGATWALSDPPEPVLVETAPDGYVLAYYPQAGLRTSPDDGATLRAVGNGPAPDVILHLAIRSA